MSIVVDKNGYTELPLEDIALLYMEKHKCSFDDALDHILWDEEIETLGETTYIPLHLQDIDVLFELDKEDLLV